MNISLTPQLEEYIRNKVESGNYTTASEVVREALRHMQELEAQREWLRQEVAKGLEDVEAGRVHTFDKEELKAEFERIKQEGRGARESRKPVNG